MNALLLLIVLATVAGGCMMEHIDPKTYEGRTPPNHGFVHRGVAYWAERNDQRILFGTGDAYLIALDATTGQPIPTFGQGG